MRSDEATKMRRDFMAVDLHGTVRSRGPDSMFLADRVTFTAWPGWLRWLSLRRAGPVEELLQVRATILVRIAVVVRGGRIKPNSSFPIIGYPIVIAVQR